MACRILVPLPWTEPTASEVEVRVDATEQPGRFLEAVSLELLEACAAVLHSQRQSLLGYWPGLGQPLTCVNLKERASLST